MDSSAVIVAVGVGVTVLLVQVLLLLKDLSISSQSQLTVLRGIGDKLDKLQQAGEKSPVPPVEQSPVPPVEKSTVVELVQELLSTVRGQLQELIIGATLQRGYVQESNKNIAKIELTNQISCEKVQHI